MERALERPAGERAEILRAVCGDDPELIAEARSMLALDADALDELAPPFATLAEPESIGGYEVEAVIGRGGMSTVYRARRRDGDDPRSVAVKLLRRGFFDPDLRRRFEREGEILHRFRHPHIAALYDSGVHLDGRPYLVMEEVVGEPIDAYCRRHGLDLEARLRLFATVCSAVAYAHRNLVVHRDLKPSNILITASGEPKLVDFGISKLLDAETLDPTTVTRHGWQLMTPQYASPEQIRGEQITTACDIYGLGVVLYELVAGRRPFDGPPEALLRRILDESPERPSRSETAIGRVGADLDAIVLRTLEKDPRRRYATVDALEDDLDRHLHRRPVRARSVGPFYRAAKLARRQWRLTAALAALVLVLVGAAWERERTRSELQRQRDQAVAVREFLVEVFEKADPRLGNDGELGVSEVLERGIERLDDLRDRPQLRADLAQVLGRVEHNLGRFERARGLLEESLALQREHRGDDSVEATATRDLLGQVHDALGEHEVAGGYFEQALAERRRQDPRDEVGYTAVLNNLALNLAARGRRAEAEAMARENLDHRRAVFGDEHEETATGLNNLGYILLGAVDPDHREIESLFRGALEIRRRTLGEEHPDIAVSHNNLGSVLVLRGDLETAREHLEEAASIWTRFLGENHPDVLVSRMNLVTLRHRLGDRAEALDALDSLMPRIVTHTGEDSPISQAARSLLRRLEAEAVEAEAVEAEALEARAPEAGALEAQRLTGEGVAAPSPASDERTASRAPPSPGSDR